ncbi:MAG TPA: preprotein translocase subunit YajC [Gaiellaceae bacterium]|nr:preprotein translocase subunit YajC [Gaiellaceae bacterium]
MNFLIIMVLLLVVMYVLMIRPQRKRQQEQQSMIAGAGVGDDVLTTGGIYGTVTRAEGDDLVVEIADGLSVHMTRRGIAAVLPPEVEAEDVVDAGVVEAEMSEAGDEAYEADEVAVTEGEESVTSGSGANTTTDDRR